MYYQEDKMCSVYPRYRSRMDRVLVIVLGILLSGAICTGKLIDKDPGSLGDLEKYLQPDSVGVEEDDYSDRSARNIKSFRCDRPCVEGGKPRICYYRFYVEAYHTLGVACGNCPSNVTQCLDPQCVTADGYERGVLTVNRRLPGPSIQVCRGDRVIVDVKNLMPGRSTTIHWHGVFQRGTPYSDGVPMVTQCPIYEGAHYRYDYRVPDAGTMFWHSHDGVQKVDGLIGSLVVRQPRSADPNSHLYDHDLRSHVMLVTDWFHLSGDERFPGLRGREPGQNPDTFLINGKGRYVPTPFGPPLSSVLPTLPNFISRPFSTKTPISVFRVIPGERFRFRMIGGTCLVCPVQISIEKHRLLLIATDGTAVEPVLVDSIVFLAAERYDFVVEASQPVSSYWIHVKGLGPCEEERRAFQVAVLKYIGSDKEVPPSPHPGYAGFASSKGVTLNPLDVQCGSGSNGVCIDQLISVLPVPSSLMALEPSLRIVIPFGFHFFNRENLFQTDSYQRFFQPPVPLLVAGMINNISNVFPPYPILSQRDDIPLHAFCADGVSGKTGCNKEHCECFQVLTLPLGAVVELLIADESPMPGGLTHPFHIHGHEFRVMAVGLFSQEQNIRKLMEQLSSGKLQLPRSNLAYRAPPAKDTVAVPAAGYAVVRFIADNPGYWMMHCHFLWHQHSGMNLIVQVGEPKDMAPVPAGFPRCGDYLPAVHTDF